MISSTTVGSTLQYSNGQAAETLKFVGDDIFISGVNDFGGDETLTFIKVSTSEEGLTVGTSDDTLEVVELGSSDDNEPLKSDDTPETSTPETSSPSTSTPETSSPSTSTPETSTPETSTPSIPDDHDGMSSDVDDKLNALSGKLLLGSGGLSLVSLLTVGGIVAMIAALFHFVKTQFPGAFQFPPMPGMHS